MKIIKILFAAIICCISINVHAMNDYEENVSEIEYAVKQINRICPTHMWDSWTFKDVVYEKKENTVYFIIQLTSWENKKYTQEKYHEFTKMIVENFKEAYEYIYLNKTIFGDGDFMLYLSVGTLIHKMAATNIKLQIVLMKPDQECVIHKDIPLVMEGEELNKILNK